MIKEHDIVALVRNLPEHGLKKGQIGAVVMIHDSSGYEVEFVDSDRKTIAVVSVSVDLVRPASVNEQSQSPAFSIDDGKQPVNGTNSRSWVWQFGRLIRRIRLRLFRQSE